MTNTQIMDLLEDNRKLGIKDLAPDDRPREKMMGKGTSALSNAELLAILIGSGSSRESAVALAQRILLECNNDLDRLARLSIRDMCKRFKGIGPAKAVSVAAALELGRRRKTSTAQKNPVLSSSSAVFEVFSPILADLPHEEIWVALLNQANRLISVHRVSQGGISSSMADVRVILKLALDNNAVAFILAHNHPSGTLRPSHSDSQLTTKVAEAARLMDIRLLDHIIVAGNQQGEYYSFADNGLI